MSKKKQVKRSEQAAILGFGAGIEAGKTAIAVNTKQVLDAAASLELAGLSRYASRLMAELHEELTELTAPAGACPGCSLCCMEAEGTA